MDQELSKKIEEQGLKIDAIYQSVEKTRKYFLIVVWFTVATVVLPLIILAFVLPSFISTYVDTLSELGI